MELFGQSALRTCAWGTLWCSFWWHLIHIQFHGSVANAGRLQRAARAIWDRLEVPGRVRVARALWVRALSSWGSSLTSQSVVAVATGRRLSPSGRQRDHVNLFGPPSGVIPCFELPASRMRTGHSGSDGGGRSIRPNPCLWWQMAAVSAFSLPLHPCSLFPCLLPLPVLPQLWHHLRSARLHPRSNRSPQQLHPAGHPCWYPTAT